MGKWNVRILKKHYSNGETELFPAETYYKDDSTTPNGWATLHVCGDSIEDLKFYAEEIVKACSKPILEVDEEGNWMG